jgi:hypothetical protein
MIATTSFAKSECLTMLFAKECCFSKTAIFRCIARKEKAHG